MHKAGFVNIVGNPNVGKSTLMNQLVGERISIATFKAQTTRHRIMGIVNTNSVLGYARCVETQLQNAGDDACFLRKCFGRCRCVALCD